MHGKKKTKNKQTNKLNQFFTLPYVLEKGKLIV